MHATASAQLAALVCGIDAVLHESEPVIYIGSAKTRVVLTEINMNASKHGQNIWQKSRVERNKRAGIMNQQGATLWLTGLSGAGKSSTAFFLEHELVERNYKAYVLDGDDLRRGLNSDLGFTSVDREENVRRAGEAAKLLADAGLIVIASFISPFSKDRRSVRNLHENAGLRFVEIFIDTPLEVCEQRDPKQLYAKARRGEISDFTGISSPYERPDNPDITIGTSTFGKGHKIIIDYLMEHNIIGRQASGVLPAPDGNCIFVKQ